MEIEDLNPEYGDEISDPDYAASAVKDSILDVRTAVVLRAVSIDRKLKTLSFKASSVPECWKDDSISSSWASDAVEFDDCCWDTYLYDPFQEVKASQNYYEDVMTQPYVLFRSSVLF